MNSPETNKIINQLVSLKRPGPLTNPIHSHGELSMPICAELHADNGLTVVHQHVFDSLDKPYAAITLAEPGSGGQLVMYFSEVEQIEELGAALQKLGNELAERKGQWMHPEPEVPTHALKLELTEEQMAEVQAGRDVVVHHKGKDYPVSGIVEAATDEIPLPTKCSNCKETATTEAGLCADCAALAEEIAF